MARTFFVSALILILGYQVVMAAEPAVSEPVAPEAEVKTITPATGLDKAELKLREVLGPIYESLEIFRKKEAEHFAIVRDKAKAKLGINLAEDALERIKPFLAPPSAPSAIPGTEVGEELEVKKLDSPKDYVVLIGSTALASLFANPWMFYIAIVLLFFFLIRLVFKMIV